jgi:hypothetical protein
MAWTANLAGQLYAIDHAVVAGVKNLLGIRQYDLSY